MRSNDIYRIANHTIIAHIEFPHIGSLSNIIASIACLHKHCNRITSLNT